MKAASRWVFVSVGRFPISTQILGAPVKTWTLVERPAVKPKSFKSTAGLWGMTTSVLQQKGLPKDYVFHMKGDSLVSQKWGQTH